MSAQDDLYLLILRLIYEVGAKYLLHYSVHYIVEHADRIAHCLKHSNTNYDNFIDDSPPSVNGVEMELVLDTPRRTED